MAPLSPDNTPRFRFHYSVDTEQHTFQVRSHESPSTVGAMMNGFLLALDDSIFAQTLDFVDFAPTGSSIFNPVTTGYEGNPYGLNPVVDTARAFAYTFLGRTSGGRRTRIAIFGAATLGVNYRISAGEDSNVDAAIAILVAQGSQHRAIDDLTPIWKSYADVQVNDHWVKLLR